MEYAGEVQELMSLPIDSFSHLYFTKVRLQPHPATRALQSRLSYPASARKVSTPSSLTGYARLTGAYSCSNDLLRMYTLSLSEKGRTEARL